MTPQQRAWLTKLSGQAASADAVDAYMAERDQIRQQLHADIERSRRALFKRMQMEVEDDAGHKQGPLDYEGRDQTREFDLDEQLDGYTLQSEQDLRTHLQVADLVTVLSKSLDVTSSKPVFDEDGNPRIGEDGRPVMEEGRLFSEEELGEEFYRPLVRQGVLPETFVPDAHSATRELLDGSFEAYKDRLEADVIKSGFKRFFHENSGVAKETANLGVAAASSAISFNSAATMKPSDVEAPKVEGMAGIVKNNKVDAEGVAKAAEFGWDLLTDKVPAIVEDASGGGSRETSERTQSAKKVSTFLVAAVGESVGKKLASWNLEVSAPAVLTAKTDIARIAAHLAAEELDQAAVTGVVQELNKGLTAMFTACDPNVDDSAQAIAEATTAARGALEGGVTAATVLQLWAKSPPQYPQVIKHFGDAGAAAMDAALAVSDFHDLLEDDDNKEKTQKKLGDEMTQAVNAQLAEEQQESEAALAKLGNAESASKKAGLLEKRIAQMEQDEKIIRWAADIMDRGFEAASAFLAPLAIAGSALKLAMLTAKAVRRTRDFAVWVHEHQAMLHAASPYSAAVRNFVHNSGQQARHYATQQAAEFCNLVGLIVETAGMCSGPGAAVAVAVGKGIQIGAKISSALENVLYEIEKRVDLERAWQTYRAAILRPENRKLGLIAMKKNPTLAKYAIAWGAVIKKDPLVSDFISTCGLDARTLEDPKSNLNLVVTYLELRMPDDNVVVGRDPNNDWEPSAITLTVGCWMSTLANAEKNAKLLHQDTTQMEGLLIRFEAQLGELLEDYDASGPTYPEAAKLDAARRTLDKVGTQLRSYNPKLKKSKNKTIPHAAMQEVLKGFHQAHANMEARLTKMTAPVVAP